MKHRKGWVALLCGAIIWVLPIAGYAVTTMGIQFEDTLRLISIDMPRKDVIETLGTPDYIKSEGHCLQYEHLGLSVFVNRKDLVEQIYLSRSFQGSVGGRQPSKGIHLSDIVKEFGPATATERLNYQPSPFIQTKATTETENRTDPSGKEKGEFPLQYAGHKKLYIFYNGGQILKYKYVLDEEGIAFWLDSQMQLYATVLYTSRQESAIAHLPAAAEEKAAEPGVRNVLPMVHFDFDRYRIKKIHVPELDRHVAYLKDNLSLPVTVAGHTDAIGSERYNQRLSERRAEAVRQYLIDKGIASTRIRVVGYGKSRPIADNQTAEGRAVNRRAEFEVTAEKK